MTDISNATLQQYQAAPDLLQGRVILITGAGDGIGKAAALSCAAHGATVVLLGRTIKKLEAVYDAIEAAGGPQPAIFPMNLESATPKDYQELANALEDAFPQLDGIVHNAGILGPRTPLEQYDPDAWQQVMQVNATAPFLMTQALIPLLKRSDNASLVFVSSSVGRKARAYWGAYAVSKFALEGLTQLFADELDESERPIRANSLNPGATRTPMRAKAYPAEDPLQLKQADAIMPAFLFLLGPDSQGVSGRAFDAQPPRQ